MYNYVYIQDKKNLSNQPHIAETNVHQIYFSQFFLKELIQWDYFPLLLCLIIARLISNFYIFYTIGLHNINIYLILYTFITWFIITAELLKIKIFIDRNKFSLLFLSNSEQTMNYYHTMDLLFIAFLMLFIIRIFYIFTISIVILMFINWVPIVIWNILFFVLNYRIYKSIHIDFQVIFCWCFLKDKWFGSEKTRSKLENINDNMNIIFKNMKLWPLDLGLGLRILKYYQICQLICNKTFYIENCSQTKNFMMENYKFNESHFERHTRLNKIRYSLKISENVKLCLRGIQPKLDTESIIRVTKAKYYSKFAVGVYGLPLYLLEHPYGLCTNFCLFAPKNLPKERIKFNSKCCYSSIKVFLKHAEINAEDILDGSFINNHLTYIVCLDRKSKSIVIAIRGTESLSDVIIDIDAVQEEIDKERMHGFNNKHYSHKGILRATYKLHNHIQDNEIIQEAIYKYSDWDIVVLGHSLGAGSSILLSLFIRSDLHKKQNENLNRIKCYAYAPPLIVDKELAESEIVTSMITIIANQNDIIPRLSLNTFLILKNQINELRDVFDINKLNMISKQNNLQNKFNCIEEELLDKCNLGKCLSDNCRRINKVFKNKSRINDYREEYRKKKNEIYAKFLIKNMKMINEDDLSKKDLGFKDMIVILKERLSIIENNVIQSLEQDYKENIGLTCEYNKNMYLPGKIFHILKSKHQKIVHSYFSNAKKFHTYCIYEAHREMFCEIISSERMFLDHFPNTYKYVIDKLEI